MNETVEQNLLEIVEKNKHQAAVERKSGNFNPENDKFDHTLVIWWGDEELPRPPRILEPLRFDPRHKGVIIARTPKGDLVKASLRNINILYRTFLTEEDRAFLARISASEVASQQITAARMTVLERFKSWINAN